MLENGEIIFGLTPLDYEILIMCLEDAALEVVPGSARRDTLNDLRYKLQEQKLRDAARRESVERDRLICERDAVRRKWGEDG